MEGYKEVVGRRRSIRYFQSWRHVEREKIQIMLEAARLASCAVNATFLKAIVVFRDDLDRETLDALKTPVSGLNIELQPRCTSTPSSTWVRTSERRRD